MAAKKSKGSGVVAMAGKAGIVLAAVAAGYVWRSYFPMALPFESRLVADRLSNELDATEWKEEVARAKERAEAAENERRRLTERLAEIESKGKIAERELAELKIKSVLEGGGE